MTHQSEQKLEKTMNNREEKELDIDFERYFEEKDPVLHRKSLEKLLKKVELKKSFVDLLKEKDEIDSFFLMWEEAGKMEENPDDKKSLQELGKLSKKFFDKKEYKELHKLFFDVMFRNFAKFADLESRKDFKDITDIDLYSKNIIPQEIFFQFFIMETPLKKKDFDWNRNEEVMKQNLACLIVCFEDIYDFFENGDEE